MNERKLVAVAALLGLVLFAGAALFQPAQAQAKGKQTPPTAEENRAELEKKYAETEDLVKVASTDKRPGIAAWSEIQGSADTLTWPAKYYLPWPAGESHKVYQSWNGNKIGPPRATHMQAQNYYAWDFNIVRGESICAARDWSAWRTRRMSAGGIITHWSGCRQSPSGHRNMI